MPSYSHEKILGLQQYSQTIVFSQELTTKNIEFLMFSAINYINNKGFFFGSLHGKELYDF